MENLIGLYINFQDNIGTKSFTTEQGKAIAPLTPEQIGQIRQILESTTQTS